jgi:hypothetical protein
MRKDVIDQAVIDQLPLERIDRVTFYKRDELTTDLICCDVEIGGQLWFFHEEAAGWKTLLRHLEQLPGFKQDWYRSVVHPTFARCETLAFQRN